VLLGSGSLRASRLPPFVNEGSGVHESGPGSKLVRDRVLFSYHACYRIALRYRAERPRHSILEPRCFDHRKGTSAGL
jgi:hypothetical protein